MILHFMREPLSCFLTLLFAARNLSGGRNSVKSHKQRRARRHAVDPEPNRLPARAALSCSYTARRSARYCLDCNRSSEPVTHPARERGARRAESALEIRPIQHVFYFAVETQTVSVIHRQRVTRAQIGLHV